MVQQYCMGCKRTYVPDLAKRPDFAARITSDRRLEVAFPDSTAEQREQLISGVCSSTCWEKIFEGSDKEDKEEA